MLDRVYIETSFISYLTAWPSRDLIVAAHQQLTHEWWRTRRNNYEICTSELVLHEASAGDTEAARERLEILKGMPVLEMSAQVFDLAKQLVIHGALPPNAADDAAHIAVAAMSGVAFIVTWNIRHMANATMRPLIESVCAANGLTAPIICSPEQLMGNKP